MKQDKTLAHRMALEIDEQVESLIFKYISDLTPGIDKVALMNAIAYNDIEQRKIKERLYDYFKNVVMYYATNYVCEREAESNPMLED